jgi:protocatechuate 3,4-dioxygenase alpha subunit
MTSRALSQTPWQTLGPFFHYALPWKGAADLVAGEGDLGARPDLIPDGHYLLGPGAVGRGAVAGVAIEIRGYVFDGDDVAVPDALLEIWQADAQGRYASEADGPKDVPPGPAFIGFGRTATDADGGFCFRTLKPGRAPGPGNSLQAPHIAVSVMGRGILKRLVTRIYFDGEPGNGEDPILALAPAERRHTLIAHREGEAWRFDIRLRGEGETVFFEF